MVKLVDLAKKMGISFPDAVALKDEKLLPTEWGGAGFATFLTNDGAHKLETAVEIPAAVPTILRGSVIGNCPNPNWCFVKLEGIEGRKPVLIPYKLRGKLNGKPINVHAITDANGTTYRYAPLTGHNY